MNTPQEIKIISQFGHEEFQHPIWQTEIAGDCSYWLLLLEALERVIDGKLQLQELLTTDHTLHTEQADLSDLILQQRYTVLAALQLLTFNPTQNIQQVLGFHLFRNLAEMRMNVTEKARKFDLHIGHKNSLKNLYCLAQAIFSMPRALLQQVFVKSLNLNDLDIAATSSLMTCKVLDAILYLTDQKQDYYFSYLHHNQTLGIFQLLDQLHRIDHLAPYYHYFQQGRLAVKQRQAKTEWINIIGDTYFGEFYTAKRKNKGVDDALQRYGYGHSFEAIKPFFGADDINIANLEAVFNLDEHSVLLGKKDYILGAKAQETLDEFKRIHLNTLCLGNNHLKDYGEASLKHTLTQLELANIDYIGAGNDQQQAHQCLEIINNAGQCLAIFNGYWHRQTAYQDYEFYALGHSSGVACINAILFEQIMQYRLAHPEHKIMVICHWGVDFKPIHPEQEKLANVLTQIGVDVVIGHGAHTLQPIQSVNQKPVIFGIGNGVFNSNGDFEKYQALPYGAIVRINVMEWQLKLYPIYTHNRKTFWQPRIVNQEQFEQARALLTRQLDPTHYSVGQDHLGTYIQFGF
ncbi:hypothetical protein F889_00343 [Acinetobacter colistiniresistens]|uniref:Capsule synthesis protein CapA domain-containing protein n=1 Tax=Acinetobacter colistiniresistens TaxID=280145 RepID=N9RC40_9GAMM|nr:CapA family protein [Acinetobacter colistiniresistens]ENX36185.1 hypothetical protein F889_00343 [Acinetobacter colistiniresistens]